MKYHFIAIGGSAMHNLAIALHKKGDTITGSDDEIFEPSKSRLAKYGLLPEKTGWFPEKISASIDAVVLGMHAKSDNPELLKAKELGLKIFSYPEFLFEKTKNKTRVVIGGSHGKTTTTAIIMHVLKTLDIKFDYMVGANIEGFETMVDFSDDTDIAVFEGDEYLTSPIDLRPKFHLYNPHIALITGIAWDHINVFPTFENYVEQFKIFTDKIEQNGNLIYFEGDKNVKSIAEQARPDIEKISYNTHNHIIKNGVTYLLHNKEEAEIKIFGNHNLQNISGAKQVCLKLGITEDDFYKSISIFEGAAKRLQLLAKSSNVVVYQDFAHSPSKLKATIDAVKQQYPHKKIVACMELHTYSSLNKEFLQHYKGTMDSADTAIVFYSNHALELKKLEKLDKKSVAQSFDKQEIKVFDDKNELKKQLSFMDLSNSVLLLLSSGNFDGLKLTELAKELVENS